MEMKRKTSIIAAALILAFSVTACQGVAALGSRSVVEDKESDVKEAPSETSSQEADDSLSEEELEALEQELYNTYISVNNFMVGRLSDSLGRYFQYVDIEQETFTLLDADDDYFDCYSLSEYDIEDIEKAYAMADAKDEKTELDKAFLEMYPFVSTVIETLNGIYEYTDMKSYLDDDYQRAQEYHTALMGSLEDYVVTSDAFMTELEEVASERQGAALEAMKEEGFEILYTMTMVIHLANDIEGELYAQDVWDENILDMDMEKIQPLYDEFVSYVEAMMEYSKDTEQLAAEGLPTNSAYWSSFLRNMKDTKTSLTEVLQKVKEGKELSQSDLLITEIAGNCSLSSFDTGLSAMISDYNRIISY